MYRATARTIVDVPALILFSSRKHNESCSASLPQSCSSIVTPVGVFPLATGKFSPPSRLPFPLCQDNPAREALTIKCVKVIVDNFERLPAHDATGGFNVGYRKDDDDNGDRHQDETKDGGGGGGGGGVDASPGTATWSAAGGNDAAGGDAGFGGMGGGEGGETKLEGDDEQPHPQQQEGRVIPAKFLQLISAGLSTDLDPKVSSSEDGWQCRR